MINHKALKLGLSCPIAPKTPRSIRLAAGIDTTASSVTRWTLRLNKAKAFNATLWATASKTGSQSSSKSLLQGRHTIVSSLQFPNSNIKNPGDGAGHRPAVMWFRGDLRLHDNEALTRANSESSSLLAVYCFDPRDYGKSPHGYDKTGPYRASFLIQAVKDLRNSLRAAGSELMVRLGKPEEVIPEIVRKIGASAVYCQSEPTYEENQVESRVKSALKGGGGCGARLQSFWGGTLHALDDLPFTLTSLPQTFEQYRASLKNKEARRALEKPSQLKGTPLGVHHFDAGEIPSLAELGLKPIISNSSSDDDDGDGSKTLPSQAGSENSSGKLDGICLGGESEALRQLQQFLGSMKGSSTATNSTTTSSSTISSTVTAYGSNFASCIAPWLATGCLSPRRMIEDVKSHLGGDSSSCSTTSDNNNTTGQQQSALIWVQFELLWRDFFRMMTRRYTEAPLVKKRLGEVDTSRERGSSIVPAPV